MSGHRSWTRVWPRWRGGRRIPRGDLDSARARVLRVAVVNRDVVAAPHASASGDSSVECLMRITRVLLIHCA